MSETPVLILIFGILTGNLKDVYCKFSHFKMRDKSVNKKISSPKCQSLELQNFSKKQRIWFLTATNVLLFTQFLFSVFHTVFFS